MVSGDVGGAGLIANYKCMICSISVGMLASQQDAGGTRGYWWYQSDRRLLAGLIADQKCMISLISVGMLASQQDAGDTSGCWWCQWMLAVPVDTGGVRSGCYI